MFALTLHFTRKGFYILCLTKHSTSLSIGHPQLSWKCVLCISCGGRIVYCQHYVFFFLHLYISHMCVVTGLCENCIKCWSQCKSETPRGVTLSQYTKQEKLSWEPVELQVFASWWSENKNHTDVINVGINFTWMSNRQTIEIKIFYQDDSHDSFM